MFTITDTDKNLLHISLIDKALDDSDTLKDYYKLVISESIDLVKEIKDYYEIDRDSYEIIVALTDFNPEYFKRLDKNNIGVEHLKDIQELFLGINKQIIDDDNVLFDELKSEIRKYCKGNDDASVEDEIKYHLKRYKKYNK